MKNKYLMETMLKLLKDLDIDSVCVNGSYIETTNKTLNSNVKEILKAMTNIIFWDLVQGVLEFFFTDRRFSLKWPTRQIRSSSRDVRSLYPFYVINRPGVARAVLQTASWIIH